MLSGRFTIYSKIGNLVMYKRPKYVYIYTKPQKIELKRYTRISPFFSFFRVLSQQVILSIREAISFAKRKDWPSQLPPTIPPPVLFDLLVDEGRISPRIIQQGPRREISGFLAVVEAAVSRLFAATTILPLDFPV